MKRFFIVCFILLMVCGCSPYQKCDWEQSPEPALRILFIGNSTIYTNDMPVMFARLACCRGRKVEIGLAAKGGWTLADHAGSHETIETLEKQKMDLVISQEQSEIPVAEYYRHNQMHPAARLLVDKINQTGARAILLMTWEHRDGLPGAGNNGYKERNPYDTYHS